MYLIRPLVCENFQNYTRNAIRNFVWALPRRQLRGDIRFVAMFFIYYRLRVILALWIGCGVNDVGTGTADVRNSGRVIVYTVMVLLSQLVHTEPCMVVDPGAVVPTSSALVVFFVVGYLFSFCFFLSCRLVDSTFFLPAYLVPTPCVSFFLKKSMQLL